MGDNPGLVLSARIVVSLEKPTDVPGCVLLVDYKHNFCVASVYHTNKAVQNKLKSATHVLIYNPHLVLVTLLSKTHQYNYQCIKVTSVSNLLIDGVSLADATAPS
jgi:hypothetical protein